MTVRTLGTVPYDDGLAQQLSVHAQVVSQTAPDTLLLLEHPPVYTFGKRGGQHLLLKSEAELRQAGASLVQTDRGGLVTFHGPGQLVGYPIVHLGRLGLSLTEYIRRLLEAIVRALGHWDVHARADMDRPGIWVGERKLGAVGVRLRERVTYHGFALNVTTELGWFDHIVACGLDGVRPTSLDRELDHAPGLEALGLAVAKELSEALGLECCQA